MPRLGQILMGVVTLFLPAVAVVSEPKEDRLAVVASFSTLGDLVRQVDGEQILL